MNYKSEFTRINQLVCNISPFENQDLFDVMASAIDNADDTTADDKNADWYEVAYKSVAFAGTFNDSAEVRRWFIDRGYKF